MNTPACMQSITIVTEVQDFDSFQDLKTQGSAYGVSASQHRSLLLLSNIIDALT